MVTTVAMLILILGILITVLFFAFGEFDAANDFPTY